MLNATNYFANELFVWEARSLFQLSSMPNTGAVLYSLNYFPCSNQVSAGVKNFHQSWVTDNGKLKTSKLLPSINSVTWKKQLKLAFFLHYDNMLLLPKEGPPRKLESMYEYSICITGLNFKWSPYHLIQSIETDSYNLSYNSF